MSKSDSITLQDVKDAAVRIGPYIHRTPIATSRTIDRLASHSEANISVNVIAKCENLQKIGAFKIRGATNAILSILASLETTIAPSDLTVVTHSSGNHAQALAYASRALGVHCCVIMPSNSASVKKAAVRGYGAVVTECTPTLEAREETSRRVIKETEAEGKTVMFVPPYDDARIIAGQGTLALELMEQAGEAGQPLDVLIAPVGGGGMLSGCAIAAKGTKEDNIWVVGAEPLGADDAYRSFYSRQFVPSVNPQTIADGLRTSLGTITFPLILQHVDAIRTVTETQIVNTMKLVYERMKLVVEPSAVVTLAVALYNQEFKSDLEAIGKRTGKHQLNVGVVFSGGNVDLKMLSKLLESADNV